MDLPEVIGWLSAVVLLITLGRQVYVQWRSPSVAGVSKWLFIGQVAASTGFLVYSCLLGNGVFIVTNLLILLTAVVGEMIYLRKKGRSGRAPVA